MAKQLAVLAVSLLALLSSCAQQSAAPQRIPAEPDVLHDGADAKSKRVANMHEARFIEIFLAGRDEKTGKMVAACYNTLFGPEGIPSGPKHLRRT